MGECSVGLRRAGDCGVLAWGKCPRPTVRSFGTDWLFCARSDGFRCGKSVGRPQLLQNNTNNANGASSVELVKLVQTNKLTNAPLVICSNSQELSAIANGNTALCFEIPAFPDQIHHKNSTQVLHIHTSHTYIQGIRAPRRLVGGGAAYM